MSSTTSDDIPSYRNKSSRYVFARDISIKSALLSSVLMVREQLDTAMQIKPMALDDDQINQNYFTSCKINQPEGLETHKFKQEGLLNLIKLGHHGERIANSYQERERFTRRMKINTMFKRFKHLLEAGKHFHTSQSVYALAGIDLFQMTLVCFDSEQDRYYLFDQVDADVDQLLTNMYTRLCRWIEKQLSSTKLYGVLFEFQPPSQFMGTAINHGVNTNIFR